MVIRTIKYLKRLARDYCNDASETSEESNEETFTKQELIQAVEKVQAKAGNHGMDYAGGMRNAASEIEKELLTNNE